MKSHAALTIALLTLLCPASVQAAPEYDRTILKSLFPAGAQRGTTVTVRLLGTNGGLADADSILVDGPPGVSVSGVKAAGRDQVEATFRIAADAVPGRRMVRVKGGQMGLTNFRWFFVGPLPEHVEKEKNNSLETAETVSQPVVANGRISPVLDQDCFRFKATKGENLVLAVLSHWMDSNGYGRTEAGFSDTSLELLDETGRVLAESGDVLGYDPLIEHRIPADGWYTVRVSGMGYKGHSEMIYRLTIGEVPYPTAVFPAGGKRRETVSVEFSGPNIPPGTRRDITVADDAFPVQYVSLAGTFAGVAEVPFIRSDIAGQVVNAGGSRSQRGSDSARSPKPVPLDLPRVLHGRFDHPRDEDRFSISLKKNESITLSVMAQRHLRSPVDTLIEVHDQSQTLVASNDDGAIFQGECTHDFVPFDSYLVFRPTKSGEYTIRLAEQSGSAGPRSVYQLTASRTRPDFRLFQWPDAVPVFGAGSTSAFVVETHRFGGLKSDVKISVEGLPAGWSASTSTAAVSQYRDPRGAFGHKVFVTITAPKNVAAGTVVPFRVIGRATVGEETVQRSAQPLTLYLWQEPNLFRFSPVSRAVIAPHRGPVLNSQIERVEAKPGATVEVPIRVSHPDGRTPTSMSFSINRATTHFKCSIGAPVTVPIQDGQAIVPVKVPATFKPGTYEIVIADAWNSETRKGLPGPCTQLLRLVVE